MLADQNPANFTRFKLVEPFADARLIQKTTRCSRWRLPTRRSRFVYRSQEFIKPRQVGQQLAFYDSTQASVPRHQESASSIISVV